MSIDWNFYAQKYDSLMSLVAYRELLYLISTLVKKYAPEPSDILELGCGTGSIIGILLAEHPNSHVVGLDNTEQMLKKADEKLSKYNERCQLIKADIREPENISSLKTYDVIIANNVLYTIDDKRTLLKRYKPFLKEEGIFMLSDPLPVKEYRYSEIVYKQFKSLRYLVKSILDISNILSILKINKMIDTSYDRISKEEYISIIEDSGYKIIHEQRSYADQANLFILRR